MKNILKLKQNGFAIIESLIAFLLLGIGVAALLYLQGNLMSGSSASKARAEAMELAQFRMEILRNYAEEAEFQDSLYSAVQKEPDTIPGVNAEYSVSYELNGTDITGVTPIADAQLSTADPQRITVRVNWPNSEGGSEEVSLETMLYFIKPEIVATISDQNDGVIDESDFPLPSPWISGVERAHETTDNFKDSDVAGYVDPVTTHDNLELIDVDSGGNIIFGTPADIQIITYYNSLTGLSNVEVVDGDGVVRLTSFGGIVHKIKGEIILHHDADTQLIDVVENFHLLASPPSYCVAPICANGSCKIPICLSNGSTDDGLCKISTNPAEPEAQYISYICYVPGDCTHGSTDARCSDPFNPPTGKDLNGGWYGRIGNFNLFLDKEKDMVCTADAPDNLTPSREYTTHRWELRNPADFTSEKFIAGNEGINRSLDCNPDNDTTNTKAFVQTFIIAGKAPQSDKCRDIALQYHYVNATYPTPQFLVLPPENVIRVVGTSEAIPDTLDDPSNSQWPNAYPIPYTPLTDLLRPTTVDNVVLPEFKDYCIPAPVIP